MKRILLFAFYTPFVLAAQQPYYDDVDLTLTGQELFIELQEKVSQFNQAYNYGDFRDSLLITDANPSINGDVLLTYGFTNNDGDCTTDRTRDNSLFGGNPCEFNREHVFARSLANPPMGPAENNLTGIVADPHNLRPTDVQRNGLRASRLFDNGSGNSGVLGNGNWYPGDEWKGDIARVIMYMYLRYGDRCLPELIGIGPFEGTTDMLQLFLEWNVEDPVSTVEEQRNPQLEIEYGNRNPFIDNPALATIIWGGESAEDIWGTLLNTNDFNTPIFSISPNPARDYFNITTTSIIEDITIYDITGRIIHKTSVSPSVRNTSIPSQNIPTGVYLVSINNHVEKLIIK